MSNIPYIGEILSLSSAVLWAFSVILFKKTGDHLSPLAVNPFKNMVGLTLIFITCLVAAIPLVPTAGIGGFPGYTAREYWILIISGVVGIGLADMVFLKSLNVLGAGISAIVDCMYSAFVIFFAFVMLDESLTLLQFLGGALIVSAVLFASFRLKNLPTSRRRFLYGIVLGVSAMAMMAIGIVMVKPILNKVADNLGQQIWIAGFRLLPGAVVSLAIFAVVQRRRDLLAPFREPKIWPALLTASVLGTYIALIMWLSGMALTKVSIAGILNQTSTIFIFLFAGFFLKEPITGRRIVSLILATAGVYLVFIGRGI